MKRRGFLGAVLAAGVAPYVSTTAGVLMPVRAIELPMTATEVLRRQQNMVIELLTQTNDILADMEWAAVYGQVATITSFDGIRPLTVRRLSFRELYK